MTACVKIAIGATRGLPSPRRRPSVPVCQGQGPSPPKRIVLSPTLAAAVILELFFRLPASAIMVLDYGDGDGGLDLEMVMMMTTMIQTILSLLAAVTWGACRSIQQPRLLTSLLIGHCEQ